MEYEDFLSITLSALTIGVVLSGAIGFFAIRNKAKKQASKIAEAIARETAERVANEYIQQNLPYIVESYKSFISSQEGGVFDVNKLNEGENNATK